MPVGAGLFGRRGPGPASGHSGSSGSGSSGTGASGTGASGPGTNGPGANGSAANGSAASGSAASGSGPTRSRPTIPPQYQRAFQDCASLRPTGGFGGFGDFGGGLNSAEAAAYRNCLKIHGVTLPTTPTTTPGQPPSTGGAGRGNGFAQLRNNPDFQAAAKACASLLPSRPGSTSSTTRPASA